MRQLKTTFLLLAFLLSTSFSFAQKEAYEKHWFVHDGDTLPYRLLLPQNYDASKKYPLILFLHGSGERGADNEAQLIHGSTLFLRDSIRSNYPAIVVFPQCSADSYWSNVNIVVDSTTKKRVFQFTREEQPTKAMYLLVKFLDDLENNYKINSKQRYIGGLSMGGMGTFELVRRKPKYFAAAFPICGGADPETAKKLTKVKWWIFHGLADDVVPPENSKKMADALIDKGAVIRLNLYPGVNHNSWDKAFAEPDLMPWLFAQHK